MKSSRLIWGCNTMHDLLDALLILALTATFSSDPKEVKKRAVKLTKTCRRSVKSAVLDKVAGSSKPKTEVFKHVEEFLDYVNTAQELSDKGYPGMIIVGETVYPVEIFRKTVAERCAHDKVMLNGEFERQYQQEIREDNQWMLDEEPRLALGIAHQCMNELNLKHLACDVVLFASRRFSGVRHALEIEPGVATKFSRRIGGSQYFKTVGGLAK